MVNLDYQTLGREIILESANDHLNEMENAKRVIWNSPYADPYIFEIALKRVREDKLAERFSKQPYLENIVKRVHTENMILTAVITNLERGNKKRAKRIESSQRETFYLEDVGYVDPHFRGRMHPFEENKERLRQNILEKGFDKGQDGSSKVSLVEGIYALYANLALGQNQHAIKILDTLLNLYYDEKLGLFKYSAESGCGSTFRKEQSLANILRGMSIINDVRLERIYSFSIDILLKGVREVKQKTRRPFNMQFLYSAAFCFDHFKERDKLATVRNLLTDIVPKMKSSREKGDEYDKEHNRNDIIIGNYADVQLCNIGLALMGLEEDKPNRFYIP